MEKAYRVFFLDLISITVFMRLLNDIHCEGEAGLTAGMNSTSAFGAMA